LADLLRNTGIAGIDYQFGLNTMMGANGTFTNLHYLNPGQVAGTTPLTGIYDSSTRSGEAYLSQRLSRKHYIGPAFQYSKVYSYPTDLTNVTETQSIVFFYTVLATSQFSISFFGGPQYSNTTEFGQPDVHSWYPEAGASLSWQSRRTAAALSYSRSISDGGG